MGSVRCPLSERTPSCSAGVFETLKGHCAVSRSINLKMKKFKIKCTGYENPRLVSFRVKLFWQRVLPGKKFQMFRRQRRDTKECVMSGLSLVALS